MALCAAGVEVVRVGRVAELAHRAVPVRRLLVAVFAVRLFALDFLADALFCELARTFRPGRVGLVGRCTCFESFDLFVQVCGAFALFFLGALWGFGLVVFAHSIIVTATTSLRLF